MAISNQSFNTDGATRPADTSKKDMDRALEALSSHSQKWVDLTISERIAIVERVHKAFPRVWERWTSYSVSAKGIAERKTGNDMEWLELAMITRIHTIVLTALREIKDKGNPSITNDYKVRTNGQVAVRAFPRNRIEELAYRGVAADIWLEPEVSIDDAQSRQTWAYRQSERKGKVALVLGAGNASSLPSSDVFHKLFTDLRVVVLKMNPVNSYLGPLLEEAYRALIDRGFLRIIYGGVQEGNYLTHHDLVDEVHMTGSDRTFEAIVFGPGEEGQQRKAAGTPLLNKKVDGELGCITPWVIVPGGWKEEDVPRQAAKLAFWMIRNEGYLCFAPRLIVMQESWPLRQQFLQAVVDALAQVEPIKAYYPGSAETQRKFVEAHPEAIQIGQGIKDHVPWTVIPGLDPAATDDICFRRESFSGLCGEVALEAPSIPEFLNRAVEFLNETVWGTLSATLLVNEDTLADTEMGGAVERAISDLRYGTVALNAPGTWGIYTMVCPWGGFPGSDISDIQSGNSKVANFLMLHRPEKTVIRTPFRAWPYPFLSTAKDFHVYCRKLAAFELEPSYWKLPSLFWSAIRT